MEATSYWTAVNWRPALLRRLLFRQKTSLEFAMLRRGMAEGRDYIAFRQDLSTPGLCRVAS